MNETFLVKTVNSNVILTLHRFWMLSVFVFWDSGLVSGIQGKQIPCVASERSIFSETRIIKVFTASWCIDVCVMAEN